MSLYPAHINAVPKGGHFVRFDTLSFGPYRLSVQGSSGHYCQPRADGLRLDQYDTVEIALLGKEGVAAPAELGLTDIPHAAVWGGDSVAGYVTHEQVKDICAYLEARAAIAKAEGRE